MRLSSTVCFSLLTTTLGAVGLVFPATANEPVVSQTDQVASPVEASSTSASDLVFGGSSVVEASTPRLAAGSEVTDAAPTATAAELPFTSQTLVLDGDVFGSTEVAQSPGSESTPINPSSTDGEMGDESDVENGAEGTDTTESVEDSPVNEVPDAGVVEAVLAPGEIRILVPQAVMTSDRTTSLIVQYRPEAAIADSPLQVTVNQQPIDSSVATNVERDEAQNLITQIWYGIPLEPGENVLTVQAGDQGASVNTVIEVAEATFSLEVFPSGNPQIPADGRSLATIQGRITDANGELVSQDAIVTLTASAGRFVGADQDEDRPGFQVIARQGSFSAQLQSALQAQAVRIRAAIEGDVETEQLRSETRSEPFPYLVTPPNRQADGEISLPFNPLVSPDLEAYTQIEFVTNLRPSLVTGSVNLRIGQAGTDYWGSFRDFLNPDTLDDGTQVDLDASLFAIGSIGEWLFTGAYNSRRTLNETCDGDNRLFRDDQFCEQNYPVYGDSSTVDYLTPSIDSVYLRFERTSPVFGAEPDYFMWGDYNTQEFTRASQLFTATTRQLHGFKGNYSFGNLQLTALYANNVDGFQRDGIVPNGTSGYYFLSRRLIVPGSENVFLETEELNRPGTVIEREVLLRGPDYEIDYDRGTLLFRRPIQATEFDPFGRTLVRRIITTYQFEGDNGNTGTDLYAGRLQYNFSQEFDRESWAGLSYVRENQGVRDFELYGFDFLVPFGTDGRVVGEIAHSTNDSIFLGDVSGMAYRLEANAAITPGLRGQAYYRSVDEGFANNATFSFTPGQTRYGGAIAAAVGPTTQLQFQYDHEENYGIAPLVRTGFTDLFNPGIEAAPGSAVNNSLTTISAGVQQEFGEAILNLDWVTRTREDRASSFLEEDSSQLVSRFSLPLADNLTFRAQNELNLSGEDPIYPDRTTFGIDWDVYPGVIVRLAHQFFSGEQYGNNSITSLDTLVEHRLNENTSITGRYSLLGGLNNMTGQGAIGLNHRWVVAPGLRVNLGYERIWGDVLVTTGAGQQFAQPYAVGQSASSLGLTSGDSYSVGIEYTDNPAFQASARFERRNSTSGNNTVITAAAAGRISPALTALFRYQQANFSNQLLTNALSDTANLKLGLAYRDPNDDRFNALLRYEYRVNPSTIPDTILFGTGTGSIDHTFAAEAIYAPNWRWEFYGKYALRNSTSYLAADLDNTSTVSLAQFRTGYRLGYRMDVVGETRWINQPSTGFSELGFAIELGYYLTPDLRVGLGYSFGEVNDRDFSGYRSDGGIYLGLSFKVNELLNGFGLQDVAPPQQQESRIDPVTLNADPTQSTSRNPVGTSAEVRNLEEAGRSADLVEQSSVSEE